MWFSNKQSIYLSLCHLLPISWPSPLALSLVHKEMIRIFNSFCLINKIRQMILACRIHEGIVHSRYHPSSSRIHPFSPPCLHSSILFHSFFILHPFLTQPFNHSSAPFSLKPSFHLFPLFHLPLQLLFISTIRSL